MNNVLSIGQFLLTSAMAILVLAVVCDAVVLTGRGARAQAIPAMAGGARGDTAHGKGRGSGATHSAHWARASRPGLPKGLALYATGFTAIALVLITAYLVLRTSASGYSPFANQHEFAVSFTFGILLMYLIAEFRYRVRWLSVVVLPVVVALLIYANSQDKAIKPLVPALRNSLMLTLHVFFAVLAYGAACVSFAAAILYLLHPHLKRFRSLPSREVLDDVGYKAATATFPLLTMMTVLGAVWANTAWGRYWGWDPKETAALVTWLVYGAYLHARVTRGWQGSRSAWLLILGFSAVLFAYFGNHFFGGLHSYG
ncbi:c-type cytochrome biogenesis protein CcsB [Actinomyces timonensis]|uniref:c-type cytochrome biogenesis protein CcsB n=1 Tax=Actinomyces timonensis TaxID=1288391 RepID=UPI0002E994E0|nr:c-type cytochrome biogenesis protein CcsB [Actinomyces timonensis]